MIGQGGLAESQKAKTEEKCDVQGRFHRNDSSIFLNVAKVRKTIGNIF
jgi:hypothetical protein